MIRHRPVLGITGGLLVIALIGLTWFRLQTVDTAVLQPNVTQNVPFSAQTATVIIRRATETEQARLGIGATLTLVRQTATEAPGSVRLDVPGEQALPVIGDDVLTSQLISDSQSTATAIIANATATQSYVQYSTAQAADDVAFLGTHEARIEKTRQIIDTATAEYTLYNATRTAIAVTRDPNLGTPTTAIPAEMTLTPLYRPNTISGEAMQCEPAHIGYEVQPEIAEQITSYLADESQLPIVVLDNVTANVQIQAIGEWSDFVGICNIGEELRLYVDVTYRGNGIRDAEYLQLTESVVDTLRSFPELGSDLPQRTRLRITIIQVGYIASQVDADYQIAIAAYDEGLRGDDLIEAMGD